MHMPTSGAGTTKRIAVFYQSTVMTNTQVPAVCEMHVTMSFLAVWTQFAAEAGQSYDVDAFRSSTPHNT